MAKKAPLAFVQRERAGRDRDHREAVEDQRGGVVGKAFALEHDQDAAGNAEPAHDRERRHRVRGRHDRSQQETDVPGQPDQVMRRDGDGRGREDHAADREQGDRAQIMLELAPAHRDARRIDQGRQHQKQHHFRRQFDRGHARHEGERDAGQHQQDRGRDIDPPCEQRGAREHHEQEQKNLEFGFHGLRFCREARHPSIGPTSPHGSGPSRFQAAPDDFVIALRGCRQTGSDPAP